MTRAALALLLLSAIGAAQNPEFPPRPDGTSNWIADVAGVIEPDDRDRINAIAGDLLREKQIP